MANLSEKYQKITQDNEHVSCVFLFSLEMCCSLQFFTTGLSLSLSLSLLRTRCYRDRTRGHRRVRLLCALCFIDMRLRRIT